MMKRIIFCLLLCTILLFVPSSSAFADSRTVIYTKMLDDGSYYETTIEENMALMQMRASSKSGSKKVEYKHKNGTVLWSVKVTGKFTYNGSSSSCTRSSVSTTAPAPTWSIKSSRASKSESTAKATATAVEKQYGVVVLTVKRNVSLTCSKNGALS